MSLVHMLPGMPVMQNELVCKAPALPKHAPPANYTGENITA